MNNYLSKIASCLPFLHKLERYGETLYFKIENLFISECYNCKKLSIWIHDKCIYPEFKTGIHPTSDMPDEVLKDYEEAREIINLSPRGAAALLRLCIQKLCMHLGEKGINLNDDIKSLVSKGLAPEIQMALDIVRVVGNNAVHPGSMDLRDDQQTAVKLLEVVNLIVERMISYPKKINTLYNSLPEHSLKSIEDRNERAKKAGDD